MKKKKTIWFALAAILIAALSCGLLYLNATKTYKDKVNEMTFENIRLEGIAAGVYTGECDVDFIYAKVAVTMKDGKIQSIDLVKHKNDRGTRTEVITEKHPQLSNRIFELEVNNIIENIQNDYYLTDTIGSIE